MLSNVNKKETEPCLLGFHICILTLFFIKQEENKGIITDFIKQLILKHLFRITIIYALGF